jgi:hypothetical protein
MNLLLPKCKAMQKWLTLNLHRVKLTIILYYQIVNEWCLLILKRMRF